MRNIATCYSEHAVKVSDSYCSGPLNKSSYIISPKSIPSSQNIVTCTYKSIFSNHKHFFVTITWCNKFICQGFFIKITDNISKPTNSRHGFHKISKIKGFKSLVINSGEITKVDLHWDLSNARFETVGPVPLSEFYVVVTLTDSHDDTQNAIIIGGDMRESQIVEDLTCEKVIPKTTLVSQYEEFIGSWNNQINSKAKMSEFGNEHEITIKCNPEDEGPRNPVLSVYVDKKRVVRVKKLQWNFRGNQVIFVDGLLIDVMWDVYAWYFHNNNNNNININSNNNNNNNNKVKNGCGLFMFRTRSGLDSRLWMEEEEKKLIHKNHDKPEFSLLISVSSNNSS